ncbi:hypothetical protein C8R43DRAFT_951938 [Mycena crocata]|nr:hypothetical protein C8R43DRAFT_951938 [Mycena crocata]
MPRPRTTPRWRFRLLKCWSGVSQPFGMTCLYSHAVKVPFVTHHQHDFDVPESTYIFSRHLAAATRAHHERPIQSFNALHRRSAQAPSKIGITLKLSVVPLSFELSQAYFKVSDLCFCTPYKTRCRYCTFNAVNFARLTSFKSGSTSFDGGRSYRPPSSWTPSNAGTIAKLTQVQESHGDASRTAADIIVHIVHNGRNYHRTMFELPILQLTFFNSNLANCRLDYICASPSSMPDDSKQTLLLEFCRVTRESLESISFQLGYPQHAVSQRFFVWVYTVHVRLFQILQASSSYPSPRDHAALTFKYGFAKHDSKYHIIVQPAGGRYDPPAANALVRERCGCDIRVRSAPPDQNPEQQSHRKIKLGQIPLCDSAPSPLCAGTACRMRRNSAAGQADRACDSAEPVAATAARRSTGSGTHSAHLAPEQPGTGPAPRTHKARRMRL